MGHSIPSDRNKELNAPWIDTAQKEIGVTEVPGKKKSDPRILEYFKDSKLNFGTVEDTQTAWCGSFAAWVMIRNGITPPKDSFRATEWLNFGQRLDKPVYGAIGFKPRKGGGHVSFIVGQSEDGVYYYMLGGNQKNSVRVSKYLASVWTGFVFPSGMSGCPIPIYGGAAEAAGSEA
jgi:uncharacterized protein (TIGR02594 family)